MVALKVSSKPGGKFNEAPVPLKPANDNRRGSQVKHSEAAKKLAGYIKVALKALVPGDEEIPEEFAVDLDVVERIVGGTFWDAQSSKLNMVNPDDQTLVRCSVGDAQTFIKRSHGCPVDLQAAGQALGRLIIVDEKTDPIKIVSATVHKQVLDHLKYHNQRSAIEWRVDMFASAARIELREHKARVTLPHRPIQVSGPKDNVVVSDYLEHFPELNDVLELIVAARFAGDRKKAYLWLLADSDWGKGFLLGVLRELGVSVEMSVREVEALFEGKPIGRQPTDFVRAFALVIDEFKSVKSEIKQLQSTIPLAPKFQMVSDVEVFAKLFTSAEQVRSLVGEHGVENQFANRFSMIEKSGSIEDRDVFARDKDRYHRAVTSYVGRELNRMIAAFIQLGAEAAAKRGRGVLDKFIAEHGIARSYGRLSDSQSDLVAEFVQWIVDQDKDRERSGKGNRLLHCGGEVYLPAAGSAFSEFVSDRVDPSERATIGRKVGEVLRLMSADGLGSYPHRLAGKQTRSVKIRRDLLS